MNYISGWKIGCLGFILTLFLNLQTFSTLQISYAQNGNGAIILKKQRLIIQRPGYIQSQYKVYIYFQNTSSAAMRLNNTRPSRKELNPNYPKDRTFMTSLFAKSAQEIFQDISQYETPDELSQIMAVAQMMGCGSSIMCQTFREALVTKMGGIMQFIRSRGIDVTCPKQNKFRQTITLLACSVPPLATKLVQQACIVLTSTQDIAIVLAYLDILIGVSPGYKSINQGSSEQARIRFLQDRPKLNPQTQKSLTVICSRLSKSAAQNPEEAQTSQPLGQVTHIKNDEDKLILRLKLFMVEQPIKSKLKQETQKLKNQITSYILLHPNNCSKLISAIDQHMEEWSALANLAEDLLLFKFHPNGKMWENKHVKDQKECESLTNQLLGNPNIMAHNLCRLARKTIVQNHTCSTTLSNQALSKFITSSHSNYEKTKVKGKISSLIDLLIKLLQPPGEKLQVICLQSEQDSVEFVCNIFTILMSSIPDQISAENDEISQLYQQEPVKAIIGLYQEIIKEGHNRGAQFMDRSLEALIKYVFVENDKKLIKDQQLLKTVFATCVSLVGRMGYLPTRFEVTGKFRYILQKWGSIASPSQPQMARLVELFICAFFSSKCTFPYSLPVFKVAEKLNQTYCEVYSRQMLSQVVKIATLLRSSYPQPELMQEGDIFKFNLLVYKVYLCLGGKLELTTAMQIAEILHPLYISYAHVLKKLFHFRTWIKYYHRPSDNILILQQARKLAQEINKIGIIVNKDLSALECLATSLPPAYADKEEEYERFNTFTKSIAVLQNCLDLKTINQTFSESVYFQMMIGVLRPLSICCQKYYNKILGVMSQSKQKTVQIEKQLSINIVSHQQSIYRRLSFSFFDLKMAFRVFLNNIGKVITQEQAKSISNCVALLFKEALSEDSRECRNAVQLVNDILSGQRWKKQSRLTFTQLLTETLPSELAQELLERNSNHIPLVVAVSLYNGMGQSFAKYLRIFTQLKNRDSQQFYRFNHQIGSEKQLVQLTSHRESLNFASINTMTSHANEVLRMFFLPDIKVTTKQCIWAKYGLYLFQISQMFSNSECQQVVVDHMQKVIQLWSAKQQPLQQQLVSMDSNSLEQLSQIIFISQDQFKEMVGEKIANFLANLAQNLYKVGCTPTYLNNLYQFLTKKAAHKYQLPITAQEFVKKLIQIGYREFLQHLKTKKQQMKEVSKPLGPNSGKQQDKIGSDSQKQLKMEPVAENQARKRRLMKNRRQKEEQIRMRKEPTYVFLLVLGLIEAKDVEMVRYVYRQGINNKLIEYLDIATSFEISQILSYINETLPSAKQMGSMTKCSANQLIAYYFYLAQMMSKLEASNFDDFHALLVSLTTQIRYIRKCGLAQESTKLETILTNIYLKSLKTTNFKNNHEYLKTFLNNQKDFVETHLQFRIKAYILCTRDKILKKQAQTSEIKLTASDDHVEVAIDDYLLAFRDYYEIYPEEFVRLTRSIFTGSKDGIKLIYQEDLQSLSNNSRTLNKLITYQPSTEVSNMLQTLVSDYCRLTAELSQKIDKPISSPNKQNSGFNPYQHYAFKLQQIQEVELAKRVAILEACMLKVVRNFQILIPAISRAIVQVIQPQFKNVEGESKTTFIVWLVRESLLHLDEIIMNRLVMFMNHNGLVVFFEEGIEYRDYVCGVVMAECIAQMRTPPNQRAVDLGNVLYLLCYCLGVKRFNDLSFTLLLPQIQLLISKLSAQDKQCKRLCFLLQQCLYLIYKHRLSTKTLIQNSLYQSVSFDEFISYDLFFGQESKWAEETKQFDDMNIHNSKPLRWESVTHLLNTFYSIFDSSMVMEEPMVQRQDEMPIPAIEIIHTQLANLYAITPARSAKISLIERVERDERCRTTPTIGFARVSEKLAKHYKQIREEGITKEAEAASKRRQNLREKIKQKDQNHYPTRTFREMFEAPIERIREEEIRVINQLPETPINFIKLLQKSSGDLTQNNFKILSTHQEIMRSENNVSEEDPQLMQNQSYRKLAKMDYIERCRFLLTANYEFFCALPTGKHWEILIQSRVLKHNRGKQLKQKMKGRQRLYPNKANNADQTKKQMKIKQDDLPLLSSELILDVFWRMIRNVKSQKKLSLRKNDIRGISLFLGLSPNNLRDKIVANLITQIKQTGSSSNMREVEEMDQIQRQLAFVGMGKIIQVRSAKATLLSAIEDCLKSPFFDFKSAISGRNLSTASFCQISNKTLSIGLSSSSPTCLHLNQLMYEALEAKHSIVGQLIQLSPQWPSQIVRKIFEMMVNDNLSEEVYNNLEPLSKNPMLKQLLNDYYSGDLKPPFKLVKRIIKYEFGKFGFLKQLLLEELKEKTQLRYGFFNLFMELVSIQELQGLQDKILEHKDQYLQAITRLYQQNQPIKNSPFAKILKLPKLFDYEFKVKIFKNGWISKDPDINVADFEDQFSQIIRIDPRDVFGSSFNQVMCMSEREIKRKVAVDYMEMPDGMGIGYFRIWIHHLYEYMVNTQILVPLSKQAEHNIYQLNPQLKHKCQNYLSVCKFLGRVLAMTVLQDQVFPCTFPRVFYKKVLNLQLTYKDLQEINTDLYHKVKGLKNSLEQDPNSDIASLQVKFEYEVTHEQKTVMKPMILGGQHRKVTKDNFEEFIKLAISCSEADYWDAGYEKIRQGFLEPIPFETLQIFAQDDLEKLISGVPQINVGEMEKQMRYEECSPADRVVRWFWELMNECGNWWRVQVVQLIHGSERLPYGGMKKGGFKIAKDPSQSDKHLPYISSCGSFIKLPNYSTKQILKRALDKAIQFQCRR